MSIIIRPLLGKVQDVGGVNSEGTLLVKPILVTPADAQVMYTHRERTFLIIGGDIEDGATLEGGCNYEFTIYDVNRNVTHRFSSGVANINATVYLQDLYLSAVLLPTIEPNVLFEGDTLDKLIAPNGATPNQVIAVDSDGTSLIAISLGAATDANYVYTKSIPATVWQFSHGLNKFPAISIVDTAGTEVTGKVEYVDSNGTLSLNDIRLTFLIAFSGKAFCN